MSAHELRIERLMDAPVAAVWKAYTQYLAEWFCPKPWYIEDIEQDWRTGGRSAMIMKGPNGEEMPQEGIYLEVILERRIVSTDAFTAGWNPAGPFMVTIIDFEPQGDRTLYRATARHWTAETRDQHEAMGFAEGWGKVAEQLEEVARRLA